MCSGHPGFEPRPCDTGNSTVIVEGQPAHCVGDHWMEHGGRGRHDSFLMIGSPTVYIGGLPCGRVGDEIECGSFIATGAATVFIE